MDLGPIIAVLMIGAPVVWFLLAFWKPLTTSMPEEWYEERRAAARGTGNNNVFVDFSDATDEYDEWLKDMESRTK